MFGILGSFSGCVRAFFLGPCFDRHSVSGTTAITPTTTSSATRLLLWNDQEQQHIESYDGRLSEHSFAELYSNHLPPWLVERLQACGWEYPTLIQERALNAIFFGETDVRKTNNHKRKDAAGTTGTTKEQDANEQVLTIPNSMVIQAQTGSGKTLTYLLPLVAKLQHRSAIQAMIVVPTRELGLQVAKVAKRLASGAPHKILIMSLLQGSTLKRQRAWAWAETPQVVIGTPCELLDMVQYGGLPRINSIQYVVVDEVDACLVHQSGASLGTATGGANGSNNGGAGSSDKDTKAIASALHILLGKHLSPTYSVDDGTMFLDDPNMAALGQGALSSTTNVKRHRQFQSRQTIFASATIPQHRHFLKQCQANQWTLEQPLFVCTSPGEAMPPTLQHGYLVCSKMDLKVAALRRILKKLTSTDTTTANTNAGTSTSSSGQKKILIFCDAIRPMEEMAMAIARDFGGVYYQEGKALGDHQPAVSVLRMEDSLSQRAGATDVFRSESSPLTILLTGDMAARGLDIPGITHVVHFDLPPNADTYLHRSGRAGRFGRKGQVLSIVTPEQEFVLERLTNALQLSDRLACVGRQKVAKKSNNVIDADESR
jgi:superfamily II DNA/RNA helicase